jgi:hypothetical protein
LEVRHCSCRIAIVDLALCQVSTTVEQLDVIDRMVTFKCTHEFTQCIDVDAITLTEVPVVLHRYSFGAARIERECASTTAQGDTSADNQSHAPAATLSSGPEASNVRREPRAPGQRCVRLRS